MRTSENAQSDSGPYLRLFDGSRNCRDDLSRKATWGRPLRACGYICTAGVASLLVWAGFEALASPRQTGDTNDESLEVRYARTALRLAQIEVEELGRENSRVPGVIPEMMLERARAGVQVAEAGLKRALAPSDEKGKSVHTRFVEEQARLAEQNLKNAENARRDHPESISDFEMERLRVAAEHARLRAALWRDTEGRPLNVDRIERELEQISNELIDLNQHIKR